MATYRGSTTPGAGSTIAAQAEDITYTPADHVDSNNVQDAITELGDEKVAKAGDTMTGDLTVPNLVTSGNVDGRDVSVDGTKLDGIESEATKTSRKNVLINGNFAINQRGVSGTVILSAGEYGHDRFKAGASGCTYTFATSAGITTLTITAGSLQQIIEGDNLETATYILSWTGTSQGKIGAGAYSSSGVTGSVTGGSNLTIEWNTGTLSLTQLEKGSAATDFERRSIGEELALCKRYYRINDTLACHWGEGSATNFVCPNPYYSQMRVTPTASIISGTNKAHRSGVTLYNVTGIFASGTYFDLTTTPAAVNVSGQLIEGCLGLDAEL